MSVVALPQTFNHRAKEGIPEALIGAPPLPTLTTREELGNKEKRRGRRVCLLLVLVEGGFYQALSGMIFFVAWYWAMSIACSINLCLHGRTGVKICGLVPLRVLKCKIATIRVIPISFRTLRKEKCGRHYLYKNNWFSCTSQMGSRWYRG